jgi:purine catabolism regulator
MYQANIQGISMSSAYVSVVFRQTEQGQSMRGNRKELVDAFQSSSASRIGKMALLEENEGILLLDAGDASVREKEKLCRLLEEFRGKVQELCSEMKLEFGVCRDAGTLAEIQTSVSRCRSVLSMGRVIFPKESIWDYEMLGPLAWLKIPEDELEAMLAGYRELLKEEKNEDLLRTLKVYLENNMNYSVTAEKLYVHINTIRKRIDRIRELLPADWDDPVGRLKTELLLQFLGL